MNKKLLSLYGLKWNPFGQEVPSEGLLKTSRIESFCWRIEQSLIKEGGFALITGEIGAGKSVALRFLAERLSRLGDVTVGAIDHPQSNLADFYREMGDVFRVTLKPHNRWCGFKALRDRWNSHIETTLMRPVLLIDEAQEMSAAVLNELRILSSTHFDSRLVLSVIMAGDRRLPDRLGEDDLLPLGSRIRTRLVMDFATREELQACLRHRLQAAGNASLMTQELMGTLCEHAAGSFRTLTSMGNDLLTAAAEREATQIDEKLFFEVFQVPRPAKPEPPAKTAGARRR